MEIGCCPTVLRRRESEDLSALPAAGVAADDLPCPGSFDAFGTVDDEEGPSAETTGVGCGDVEVSVPIEDVWRLGFVVYQVQSRAYDVVGGAGGVTKVDCQLLCVHALEEGWPDRRPGCGEVY